MLNANYAAFLDEQTFLKQLCEATSTKKYKQKHQK